MRFRKKPVVIEAVRYGGLPEPTPGVLDVANLIRLTMGYGGATFPGADDLYAGVEKIEAWKWSVSHSNSTEEK